MKQIIKNRVYLWLLAFYNTKIMPSYSALSQELEISRQTVSVKIKELIDKELIIIQDDKKLIVNNPYNINIFILQKYLKNTSKEQFDNKYLLNLLEDTPKWEPDKLFVFNSEWMDYIKDFSSEQQDKALAELIRVNFGMERLYKDDPLSTLFINLVNKKG